MDPTSTPWRALEDSPDRRPGGSEPAPTPIAIPRSSIAAGAGAVVLALVAFFLAFGSSSGGTVSVEGGAALATAPDGAGPSGPVADRVGAAAGASFLILEIVGAVDSPGVYRLPPGSRVGDLVQAAGGYGPRVDADRAGRDLNLAAPLHDGDQVRVPSRDDQPPDARQSSAATGTSGSAGVQVDLNHATAAELDALPGIGPVTAAKIIASRDQQSFTAVQDLRTRKLVGEKAFATLKDLVSVR